MDIYVFSDESGVFDKAHNDYFVFGGVIFFSKEDRDNCARKYIHVENTLRKTKGYEGELKACRITNGDKGKLFRTLSTCQRFGIVVRQKKILDRIFNSKKDKQRYLDYVYKIGLKRLFQALINSGTIVAGQIENIYVLVDEHSTATNGKYELRESLEQEFKFGTYNYNYSTYFPPIFEYLKSVTVDFCNSANKPLIRAADIIANRIYYWACAKPEQLKDSGVFIVEFP